MKKLSLCAVALLAFSFAGPASAAISICGDGVSCPSDTELKVFFDNQTVSNSDTGGVGSNHSSVSALFTAGSDVTFANGFATIKPVKNGTLNTLTFTIPGYQFTDLLFDAQFTNNGPLDLTISANNGAFSQTITPSKANADLSFGIFSDTPLTQVQLSSISGFKELKHFEVSGLATLGGGGPPGAVPEASTWAMMLIGFAGLGFAGYRSRKRAAQDA